MKHERTFRVDKLYYKFLKPKGIPARYLPSFTYLLETFGFIRVSPDKERYEETIKMTSGQSKIDLFKIIEQTKRVWEKDKENSL